MNNVKKYSGIVLLILLVLAKIQDSNFVMKVENISYDIYQTLFMEKSNYDEVVIVDIDEKSIGEIGQFPWRRDVFANLIDRLNQYQVSVIAFDIFFSEEDKQNPKRILEEFDIENNKVIDSDQSLLDSIKNLMWFLQYLVMYLHTIKIINQNLKQTLFLVEWMLQIMFIVLKIRLLH